MPDTPTSERTPLMDHDECDSAANHGDSTRFLKETPLPKVQLGILCLLRILDPMCFTQIFPYINELVSDLHVAKDPSQIGFYSGLVESSFALSQLITIYPWGYLSDRFGRRPMVLVGVAGLTLTTILFGLSTDFTTVMITRALAGLFSGNVAVIPSMLIEITDKTNQALAFPFFGFWWPVGAIVGPLLGGLFSKPATRYPRYFDYPFLREYPYFLPCLLVAGFSALSFFVAWFWLNETRQVDKRDPQKASPPSYGSTDPNSWDSAPQDENFSVRELLNIPIIRALCASGCALSFLSSAFDVLFVLFCYSPIRSGGLAFDTSEIGFALSASGFLAALLQAFIMPTILRRVNHAVMYHFSMKIWPYLFVALPFLNIIARHGVDAGNGQLLTSTIALLWTGIVLILAFARVAFLSYSVNMLLIKQYAPNSASLGSTAGLVQFCICLSRAIGPAFASSMFALSAEKNLLWGYLWVLVMASIGLAGCLVSRNIVKESSRLQ
ncbi:unnamed protein product [Cyclocybe aegerita]|uniref:Major facilitator superfamily (MFS) profile domain-containing protein n=1 Tax=Cyclocybe aegerita TaxID=1973307 RepID=A0A8S0VSY4_CYCAE|nr:unnamed protein product [Cyclocybe aegerita]